jgi:hypothetical protein
MARKPDVEELRQAVLGNRGREVEVTSDGQVVVDPENNQRSETQPDRETDRPKVSKMSPHTFGR